MSHVPVLHIKNARELAYWELMLIFKTLFFIIIVGYWHDLAQSLQLLSSCLEVQLFSSSRVDNCY